jgi:hypothetical protein
MTDSEKVARLEAVIKRTEKFQPLFENELFKEYNTILSKKMEVYRELQTKAPRVGEIKTMEQVTILSGEKREIAKVPYRVTREERISAISELQDKIDELKSVIDIPMLMMADADRMKVELEKIKGLVKGDK